MLYQALFGRKPNIACLKEFGMHCWVMVPDQCRTKLDPKAEEHMFVGIAEHAKAWKYFNRASKHVQISRNITFDESDNKLYTIPNHDDDTVDAAAPLEGEQAPITVPPKRQSQMTLSTPQTSPEVMPTPDPPAQAPVRWSACITQ
jgi:hypothetical protein